jgi:predicted outer membrane repeat protein
MIAAAAPIFQLESMPISAMLVFLRCIQTEPDVKRRFRGCALWAAMSLAGCASAWATDAVVSTCDQNHFQTALTAANTAPGGTITFTCSGTIALSTNLTPDFVGNGVAMVIDGGNNVVLDGGNTYSFWQVYAGGNLTLKRLTLQHGGTTGNSSPGHPIQSFGPLTLDTVTVSSNSPGASVIDVEGSATIVNSTFSGNTVPGGNGAAIANHGTTQILGSNFSNHSVAGGQGGAISNVASGALYVSNSTFTSNSGLDGGAIWGDSDTSGIVHINGSTFNSNTATYGGAVETDGNQLTIERSTFNSNHAFNLGGALWSEGSATPALINVNHSEFSGNSADSMGGAIECDDGTLYVNASTFSGNLSNQGTANFSNHGGAIFSGCLGTIAQSTFYNNSAPGSEGGGVYFGGNHSIGVYASTFVSNQAQEGAALGSSNSASGGPLLSQLILSGNTLGHSCSGGPFSSSGYNLADDSACGGDLSDPTDNSNVTLTMGALANNGGPTRTLLPAAGNPAINYVPKAQCDYAIDQRGALRPTPAGGSCDSGAVEVGGVIDEIFVDGFELP